MSELEPDLLEIHFGAPSAETEFERPLPDHASRPCSRNFRYKFRSLIPSILAAFPR